MMGNIFDTVKAEVQVVDVINDYGVTFDRHGKGKCPFHNDKTPSFSVKGNRWHCFGAYIEGGDAIDFVAKMENITPLEAAQQLAQHYGIYVDEKKPTDISQYQKDKRLVTALENWVKWAQQILADTFRLMNDDMVNYAPKTPDELSQAHPRFIAACHLRDYIGCYLLDELIFADFVGKLAFYNELESEVDMIVNYYRQCIIHEEPVRHKTA